MTLIEPLANYYSILSVYNYATKKPLMLTKKDLLTDYNHINYIKYILETDQEIIEKELKDRGLYEKSKSYESQSQSNK